METEFRKSEPWDYRGRSGEPEVLELPPRLFSWIEGRGDPNGEDFQAAVGALYAHAFAVRMSGKGPNPPPGWFPLAVGVLQGRWDLVDGARGWDPSRKDDLSWTILLRQPAFLDKALHEACLESARRKASRKTDGSARFLEGLRLDLRDGGRFSQILHAGPYDDEPASFARLEAGLESMGERRWGRHHWEIYLSDPRRVPAEKRRTLLRVELERERAQEAK